MSSLEELLAIVGDQAKSVSERSAVCNELFEYLLPIVREKVAVVAPSYSSQWGYEFDTDDVTQEVLIHLYREILKGSFKGGNFEGWCYVVVRNKVKEIYRKFKRRKEILENYAELKRLEGDLNPLEILEEIAAPLREEMDAFIRWYDNAEKRSDTSHFPSVLWLRLRIVVSMMHERSMPEESVSWRKIEESWCFQALWPTILKIWAALSREKNDDSKEIAAIISALLNSEITASYWNTQVSRAFIWVRNCPESLQIMRLLLKTKG